MAGETQLNVAEAPRHGVPAVQLTFQALDSANGNYFLNDGKTIAIFRKVNTGSLDAVLNDVEDSYGRQHTTADKTVSVDEDELWLAGPFRPSNWNQRSGDERGGVTFSVATATDFTVAIIRFPEI